MILHFIRDGRSIGELRCAKAPSHAGFIDLNSWFCPACGRVFATTQVGWEPDEDRYPFHYHVILRYCGDPLFDLAIPHPTFWIAANRTLMLNSLKEYFNGRHGCRTSAADYNEPYLPFEPDTTHGAFRRT